MKVPSHTLHILTTPLDKNKPSHANPKLTAKRKMILTNCAACAAPLTHDAPRCVRCLTRYCSSTCHEPPEKLAQDAFRTARAKLAQERSDLAQTLADAPARP